MIFQKYMQNAVRTPLYYRYVQILEKKIQDLEAVSIS